VRKVFVPADMAVAAYFAIVTVLALACARHPLPYVGVHALAVGALAFAAWMDARGSRVWKFIHYWLPAAIVLAAFRELHYLAPEVHPFADRRWDWALYAFDARWFGDVEAALKSVWSRPASDVLSVCYWMYFPMPAILGTVLYRKGELGRFREVGAVLFIGWFLSYLGYLAVPAVGPHRVMDAVRAPELEGWICAGFFHRLLFELEWEMPNAFPSGHALLSILTLGMAWRHERRVFWWLLPFGAGCTLATVYLRYHYVVDVAASLAIIPMVVAGGRALAAWWEKPGEPRTRNAEPGSQDERG